MKTPITALFLLPLACVVYEENPSGPNTCRRFDEIDLSELETFCVEHPLARPAGCGAPAPSTETCVGMQVLHCAWTECDWSQCSADLQESACDALPASCAFLSDCAGESTPTTGEP